MTKLLARIGCTALIAMCFTFLGTAATHAYPTSSANWVSSDSSKPIPPGAVKAGTEQNNSNAGVALYVCRAAFAGGVHPGKLVGSWKWCHFGWGGYEQAVSTYEVLVQEGEWKRSNAAGVYPDGPQLVGGHEANYADLYICRGPLIIDGINHGITPGKLVGNYCHVGYGGYEWEFSNLSVELFYPTQPPPPSGPGSLSGAYYFDAPGYLPFDLTVTFTGTWISGSVSSGQTSFSKSFTQYGIAPGTARSVSFYVDNLRQGTWTVTAYPQGVGGPMTCQVTVPGTASLNVSGRQTSCTPP